MKKQPKTKDLETLCRHARLVKRTNGDVIICRQERGHEYAEWICTCTSINYNLYEGFGPFNAKYDLSKIYECAHRAPLILNK